MASVGCNARDEAKDAEMRAQPTAQCRAEYALYMRAPGERRSAAPPRSIDVGHSAQNGGQLGIVLAVRRGSKPTSVRSYHGARREKQQLAQHIGASASLSSPGASSRPAHPRWQRQCRVVGSRVGDWKINVRFHWELIFLV